MKRMKMRTISSKGNANNPRKLKKSGRRERPHQKGCSEIKKPLSQVQQNRFTNMHELSSLPSSLMQLQDMFGTLVLDFSKDPVQVNISDVTGNYELSVSKESLGEFKMKILLGQNSKYKPTFSIFLGECQCYPELPEGTLELKENDATCSQIDSISEESEIEVGINAVGATQDTIRALDDTSETDLSASLLALFESREMTDEDKNIVTYETQHLRIGDPQMLDLETNSNEFVVKMRPNKQRGSKLRKVRSFHRQPSTARRATKKRSTYRNNLEGFVKFLMDDRVCGSVLGKMKSSGTTAKRGKRGAQKIVKYSDGHEYRIVFSQDENSKKITHKKLINNDRPISSEVTDGSQKNEEETKADGIQVLFERTKFEKAAFVKQVKKELEEWKARDEKTINVEIVDADANSSSLSDTASGDSNVVTVYEDVKTSKKLDSVFDDPTSNCWTETTRVESTEKFSLDLEEKEKPEKREKEIPDKENEDEEFSAWLKSEPHKRREDEKYVAPIPLGTTSTADIEAMWLTFVEKFHHSSQLAEKIDNIPIPHETSASSPESVKETTGEQAPERNVDTCTYPGQHSLPYFVEESLKKVNSMLGTRQDRILRPTRVRKPEESSQPRIPIHKIKSDLSPGNDIFFKPKNYSPRNNRSQLFYNPGRLSVKRSRIFFNPHTSMGDWYQ